MLTKKTFFIIWLLGAMSGFTLMISSNTLNFWLAKDGIDIKTIGIFALISLPYAINFLWAPIFDTKKTPILSKFFNQRISWLILIQILLSYNVYLMGTLNPTTELLMVAFYGILVSLFASAQDTILGALRTEIVQRERQGEISGMYIFGYRIGMLISSSGAIYISKYIEWGLVYKLFSITILFFPLILIMLSKELTPLNISHGKTILPEFLEKSSNLITLFKKVLSPIGSPKYIILVIIFLILYRLPDNFISMMINPFLLHIGYDEFEISTAGKLFGVVSAILGGLVASRIMKKKHIYDSLLIFGAVHAIAHIFFVVQEIYGKNIYLLFMVTGLEGFSGGMNMSAYIAFIASLCQGKFRATQYSFLSSVMGTSRSIFPAISGYIVANFGWNVFYIFTTIATIPALMLVAYLKNPYRNKTKS
jgi:PAT family beta-lactamase induction signal transducer AmpG